VVIGLELDADCDDSELKRRENKRAKEAEKAAKAPPPSGDKAPAAKQAETNEDELTPNVSSL
jgi:hypothetical protein